MLKLLMTEPVAVWVGLATAGMDLFIAFGVHITDQQKTAILAVVTALGAAGILGARSQVSPTTKP
jgi:hypothetical protein